MTTDEAIATTTQHASEWPHAEDRTRVENAAIVLAAEVIRLRHAEERCAALVEALTKMVELAEFWINREDTRDISEERYAIWLALGHHSNAMRNARAALAAHKEKQ